MSQTYLLKPTEPPRLQSQSSMVCGTFATIDSLYQIRDHLILKKGCKKCIIEALDEKEYYTNFTKYELIALGQEVVFGKAALNDVCI